MYISKFQLSSYKSYLDIREIEFKRGFNVITGKNNTGKTALLEALTLQFEPNPHRTVATVPYPGASPATESVVRFTFVMDRKELLRLIGDQHMRYLPRPVRGFAWPSGSYDESPTSSHAFVQWFLNNEQFRIGIRLSKPLAEAVIWTAEQPTFGLYPCEPNQPSSNSRYFLQLQVDATGQSVPPGGVLADQSNDISIFLAQKLATQVYRFTAERFSMGEWQFGYSPVLAANAQNLPEVLDVLKANTAKFQLFSELVQEILPQIKHVSVRPVAGGRVQVIIWPHDPKTMREDVAIPLNQCGSGVGQVLAILYVVMTSVHPQTIIVDEPQSFLHPGAIRKLIEVLKRYPEHQYIFATHSPTVIAASDPEILIITQLEGSETTLTTLDTSDNRDLNYSLSDIGASLSDVFGADQILWVEGATEQICFPLILRDVAHLPMMGTAIIWYQRDRRPRGS